jgi:hypothetical protein
LGNTYLAATLQSRTNVSGIRYLPRSLRIRGTLSSSGGKEAANRSNFFRRLLNCRRRCAWAASRSSAWMISALRLRLFPFASRFINLHILH